MKTNKKPYRSGEHALTAAQVKKLLETVGTVEDECLFRLALTTGLRRSDIVSIRVSDINLETGTLNFYEAKKDVIRQVWLQPPTVTCLRKYMATRKRGAKLFDFSSRTCWNRLAKWCDRAGIPRRPFHALRASCIKLCQSSGWPIEATAQLVNDRISTIQGHYLTPSSEEMREHAHERQTL